MLHDECKEYGRTTRIDNNFTLYFNEYRNYIRTLDYFNNNVNEFKDKYDYIESILNELFGRQNTNFI